MKSHGGKRKGAGRKPLDEAPTVRGIRCTDDGWEWLNGQATAKGHSSVGKGPELLNHVRVRVYFRKSGKRLESKLRAYTLIGGWRLESIS